MSNPMAEAARKADETMIREFLISYAWADHTQDAKERRVACIMAQDGWRHIDGLADKYASQAEIPGPEAFDEATMFALTALYEAHGGPHQADCPSLEWERRFA